MRSVAGVRAFSLSLCLSLSLWSLACLAACGGGGGAPPGGGPPDPDPTVLARLSALLLGSAETSVTDPDARATALLVLRDDGGLDFAATAEAAWVADVVAMHLHRGAAGTDGPIEVDLLAGGATFDPATRTVAGTLALDAALAAEVAASPDQFYVNLHTGPAPGGLVRGQLAPFAGLEGSALLLGSESVPVVLPLARGALALTVGPDLAGQAVVALASPQPGEVSATQIRAGGPGQNGPVVADLPAAGGTVDAAAGTLTTPFTAPPSLVTRLALDAAAHYAQVTTASVPAGAARGQLGAPAGEMWAELRGDLLTTPASPGARGGLTLQLETLTRGRAHLAMPRVPPAPLGEGIADVTGAVLRRGAAGQDGPAVADLLSGADFSTSAPTNSAEGTFAVTPALFARMLARPEDFHAVFSTAAAPGGLVRGQLTQEPVRFFADLLGSQESVVVDPAASAALNPLTVTGVFRGSFTLQVVDPAAADVTALHVHDGVAGQDGPVLIDLLGGDDVQVVGNLVTGHVAFTGRTFARLLAFPEGFYCNLHTDGAPAGLARGQCVLLRGDVPPAGLTYSEAPAVYATAGAITPNVPSSVGGAVSLYSVSPALPTGLSLDPVTGILSGTPTQVASAADYTITASNPAGSTTFVLNLTVNVGLPTDLAYTTPAVYVQNEAITPNVPTSSGGAIASYSVSPALPAGLSLHTTTGVISGTPTSASDAADYVVTGTNASGSVDATVSIEVQAALQPPSSLSYSTPVTYSTGYAITSNTPTVTGLVTSWSISPSLPAGLSFHTSTGVISGTPTTVSSATDYTVTAGNAAGSTQATVNITVALGAPKDLSYSNTPNIGYVTGGAFATMSPTVGGGAVASWSITPALPPGVSLDTSTGDISGTPTAVSSQTTYTVTATNAAGNTTAQVTITVLP